MGTKNTDIIMRLDNIDPKKRFLFESYIGWNTSWWHYYGQYKNMIDEIVRGIERKTPIDTVSLPLMFLIRHSLELGFKANILKLEHVNTKVAKIKLSGKKYHSLDNLYKKFSEHFNALKKENKVAKSITDEIDNYLVKLRTITSVLHNLDEGSFCFRYPVDTMSNSNFEFDKRINVADVVNLYYQISPFLMYTENVLVEEGVIPCEQ